MAEKKTMSPKDAFAEIAKTSDKSMRQISMDLNHRAQYLSVLIAQSTVPQVSTFVKVANVSGWDIIARKRSDGTEIYFDPGPIEQEQ